MRVIGKLLILVSVVMVQYLIGLLIFSFIADAPSGGAEHFCVWFIGVVISILLLGIVAITDGIS